MKRVHSSLTEKTPQKLQTLSTFKYVVTRETLSIFLTLTDVV